MNVFDRTSPALDDFLLDICASIELSDNDRRVAESRYRQLKDHLERSTSPLRPFLVDDDSTIYAQGSIAVGTTTLSGDDDRFDLDAIVEMNVPVYWTPEMVLDNLFNALQGFPAVRKIERCTRCVQLQFASMHLDVTVLDPMTPPLVERAGNIFHSPEAGPSYRVPSNPWGFTKWFRESVVYDMAYAEAAKGRRRRSAIDRLLPQAQGVYADVDQHDLPPIIPSRLDAQQVAALRLLKRYIKLYFTPDKPKRPPSIYLTKLAIDVGFVSSGLTDQLMALADLVRARIEASLGQTELPDERNPSFEPDRLNDRWPTSDKEKLATIAATNELISSLQLAKQSEIGEIKQIFERLFGEKITRQSFEQFLERYDKRGGRKGLGYEEGLGTIIPASTVPSPAIVRRAVTHNFHSEALDSQVRKLLRKPILRSRRQDI